MKKRSQSRCRALDLGEELLAVSHGGVKADPRDSEKSHMGTMGSIHQAKGQQYMGSEAQSRNIQKARMTTTETIVSDNP